MMNMNPHYPECRALPAIETFPQFSQHRPAISLLSLSPLDLSLRATNIIPITPPSTPSPPRKRQRLMSEENYLWRPHVLAPSTAAAAAAATATAAAAATQLQNQTLLMQQQIQVATATASAASYFPAQHQHHHQHQHSGLPQQQQLGAHCYGLRFDGAAAAAAAAAAGTVAGAAYNKSHFHETKTNFAQIPASQSSVAQPPATATAAAAAATTTTTTSVANTPLQQAEQLLPTICVDDETIVLTEDEDETVVSSHDYNDTDVEDGHEAEEGEQLTKEGNENDSRNGNATDQDDEVEIEDEDEEVYVDILSNDDEDVDLLQLHSQLAETKALKRNELLYDDEELHNQAVSGLDRLFERDFSQAAVQAVEQVSPSKKIYTDLSNAELLSLESVETHTTQTAMAAPVTATTTATATASSRSHKGERKRTKLRKHTAIDEETISPVSGTIIRKLRDDEELVVRKGDIDPAFNVVEITEEAKAILASIDNKIGAYLCQLCRTLYDDAFMLAQHRCPRIVHIEYKCSECEKVFNCPANLASHRRWHKPKTELQASSASKKRQNELGSPGSAGSQRGQALDRAASDEAGDGIYPCHQCGKTFRRHAYLKKHQASHQMLENLKTLDFFKHKQHQTPGGTPPVGNFPQPAQVTPATYPLFGAAAAGAVAATQLPRPPPCVLYPTPKNYAQRGSFGSFPGFQHFDQQRRFYSLGEFYLSQHFERSSAFQYVQANHLRQLSNVANNLLPRSSSSSNSSSHAQPTASALSVK